MSLEIGAFDEDDPSFSWGDFDPSGLTWNGRSIALEDLGAIAESIESRIQAWLLSQDPNSPEFLRAATYFAYMGSHGAYRDLVERDIIELLNTPEGLLARGQDGVIIPVGLWSKTCHFCKKHATEILIGVVVVAVVATVVIVSAATAGTAAGAAAAAGGALLNNLSNEEEEKKKTPPKNNPPVANAPPPPPDKLPPIPSLPPFFTNLETTPNPGQPTLYDFLYNNPILSLNPTTPPQLQYPFNTPPEKSYIEKILSSPPPPTDSIWPGPPSLESTPPKNPLFSPYNDPPLILPCPFPPNPFKIGHKSTVFEIPGKPLINGRIGGINGISTPLDVAHGYAENMSHSAGNSAIEWVHNQSHSALVDLAETVVLNYHGYSSPADLLIENWTRFYDEHEHDSNAKYLQICHSQGAIHVKNALLKCTENLRDRVVVLAIAPAVVVSRKICSDSFNYASKRDIVPFGEAALNAALPIRQLLTDSDHLDELIWLDPHPDAPLFDHAFESPTFDKAKQDTLDSFLTKSGIER